METELAGVVCRWGVWCLPHLKGSPWHPAEEKARTAVAGLGFPVEARVVSLGVRALRSSVLPHPSKHLLSGGSPLPPAAFSSSKKEKACHFVSPHCLFHFWLRAWTLLLLKCGLSPAAVMRALSTCDARLLSAVASLTVEHRLWAHGPQ